MLASRRNLVTGVAGLTLGVLAGCGTDRSAAGTTGPEPAGRRTPLQAALPTTPAEVSRAEVGRAEIVARYGGLRPRAWALDLPGTITRLPAADRALALTFDACGGPAGSGYDQGLITTLRRYGVPATLFLNSRWIDANRAAFADLAGDPLFEIGNHGTLHRPLSVSGRSAYGIPGTRDAGQVYDEVAGNHAKLTGLLGRAPRLFRPGTAYSDDVAARIVGDLGETIVSFTVNGDGGATYNAAQVRAGLLAAPPGSIVIGHMNHPRRGTGPGVAAALPRLLGAGFRFVLLPAEPAGMRPSISGSNRPMRNTRPSLAGP
ncbi:polysaccharide deacetylase family protein [Frankia sp. AiPs1]|uniref:polysaccharide deacetylase family protein n=1 Tax=Frankia sp. AiPs1 TaxID=573493 RepID=UPI002043D614|nr:polysaccharide deacetylase family protein [Frankia sp. AiPs1]MCM3923759.1 polysaccharide deacetylase family protein [Frankia sp. AiPs1]